MTLHAQIIEPRSIRLSSYDNHLIFQRKTKPLAVYFQL